MVKDPIGSSDHNLIMFKCKIFKPKNNKILLYSYSKTNFDLVNKYINSSNLHSNICSGDPISSWKNLSNCLANIINSYVPVTLFDPNRKSYRDTKLKKLNSKKHIFWTKYKITHSPSLLIKYHQLKYQIRQRLKNLEISKINKIFNSKPRDFYNYINKVTKIERNIPQFMNFLFNHFDSDLQIANAFNE